ncbi:peptidylprolyl isomerase [Nannocystis pusilla]|uniref:peptidylprolyl isomerase n=1 Tax=Nannocystis pusilla TaxID=889268 RepID=UPI003B778D60
MRRDPVVPSRLARPSVERNRVPGIEPSSRVHRTARRTLSRRSVRPPQGRRVRARRLRDRPGRRAPARVRGRAALPAHEGAYSAHSRPLRRGQGRRRHDQAQQARRAQAGDRDPRRGRKPGADFEALAKQRSEDSSAERGGDLGWIGKGNYAWAFETRAFTLKPSGMSGVVETEFGFHVIERLE